MAEAKTKETSASVTAFIAAIADERRRADTKTVVKMLKRVTGCPPKMWGSSIIGFDRYAYEYASGRTGELCIIGVSPRKAALTLYIMPGFDAYESLMNKLGPHKTGKSCLYIKRLDDVDMDALAALCDASVKWMRAKYH
tara:strand:+ start:208 stop:624 length:417 start_codon:yes stop_codon:yes gene_type:complete